MAEGSHIYGNRRRVDAKRDTEGGLTKAQASTILRYEREHANDTTEHAMVVGQNGEAIWSGGSGNAGNVGVPHWALREGSVMTHSHPLGLEEPTRPDIRRMMRAGGMATRIGSPFSPADVRSAVNRNLKEVRARSANYIYSLRAPKGKNLRDSLPVGMTGEDVAREMQAIYRRRENEYDAAMRGRLTSEETLRHTVRGLYGYFNEAMRTVAKKYGLVYTRRRVNG